LHIFVTGCAGFIGWKVAEMLLDQGHTVAGVDNLNDAYDVRLKHWRLARLEGRPGGAAPVKEERAGKVHAPRRILPSGWSCLACTGKGEWADRVPAAP